MCGTAVGIIAADALIICSASASHSSPPSGCLIATQTFRTSSGLTISTSQRLQITSLTFLFPDLEGLDRLYGGRRSRCLRSAARALHSVLEIISANEGAVVKTIVVPDGALHRPRTRHHRRLRITRAIDAQGRRGTETCVKIGHPKGPALPHVSAAGVFRQTVTIAAMFRAFRPRRPSTSPGRDRGARPWPKSLTRKAITPSKAAALHRHCRQDRGLGNPLRFPIEYLGNRHGIASLESDPYPSRLAAGESFHGQNSC